MTEELWKPVPGEDGYEVSSLGRVRHGQKILAGSIGNNGYRSVSVGPYAKPVLLHRLVGWVFLGPPQTPWHEINHKNLDKLDNRAANLEWVTRRENARHAAAAGALARRRAIRGEGHGNAKLTDAAVRDIRARYTGVRGQLSRLAKEYGVSLSTAQDAATGKRWSHVS